MKRSGAVTCVCGSGKTYAMCCGRYLDGGEAAPDAQALMRSRYAAYALGRNDYLLVTWHASTRPSAAALAADAAAVKWIGLEVMRYEYAGGDSAVVEFVARYREGGRAHRLRETSRFAREAGRWFYLDGDIV